MTKIFKIATLLLLFFHSISAVRAQGKPQNGETEETWGKRSVIKQANPQKAKFFDESNFGMFVHWGLFSSLGGKWKDKTYYGIGEWLMSDRMANIPIEEYKQVAKDFNPKGFDAKALVKIAQDAGMKYIVITSKHHEGFAMFKSKVHPFNIADATPFGRDPMKELSTACHEAGMGFGFYYSHNQDWTSPGAKRAPQTFPDGKPATFTDYFYSKCLPQIKEICSNYGKMDFIWFDTPDGMKKEYVLEVVETVRKLQPQAMLCSRIGHGLGDYVSIEDMEIPSQNKTGLWETCDTNNDSWSYAWYDNNFKSPKYILQRLIATIGRGGSYLFNVGPNGDGKVPEIGVEFLKTAGDWIKRYPQVIYKAQSSPWGHAFPWGDVTSKDNSLFLSVFEWPKDGKLYLPGLNDKIVSAKVLGNPSNPELTVNHKNNWTILDVSTTPADSLISVIELKLDKESSKIQIENEVGIYPNVTSPLLADFAKVTGAELKIVRWMEKYGEIKSVHQISGWKEGAQATWTVNVNKPGHYYLSLNYCGKGRLVWKTTTDEGLVVQNQQPSTEKYNTYPMGILSFKQAGKHTVTVSLLEGDPVSSSLESVVIKPIN